MAFDFRTAFERALLYEPFLSRHATADQAARWGQMHDRARLTAAQQALLAGFVREMKVLCLAGAWCGDCVNACPLLQRIAEACPRIDLRFIHQEIQISPNDALIDELSICGGARVPVVVFLSEDGYECERFGDRTLAAYRDKALRSQGPSCPIGAAPPEDLLGANLAEWLAHFERVQLMLLTSPRLSARH